MEDMNKIVIVDKDGNEKVCEVLFTFEKVGTKTNFIVYTDNSVDEEGNTRVFASIYNPDDDEGTLFPITDEADYDTVDKLLENFRKMYFEDDME